MGISQNRLALAIHVQPIRISEIVRGKRAITADTALRFGRFFGTTADFWMRLQAAYDVDVARFEMDETLQNIEPHAA
nr:HigA family addiction module antitoxin [Magnetofaba australis]